MRRPSNILWLGSGKKAAHALASDPVLVLFILYAFSLAIITQARGVKAEVNNASLAFIDEDESQLSKELFASFFPPRNSSRPSSSRPATPRRPWIAAVICSSSRSRTVSDPTSAAAGPPRCR